MSVEDEQERMHRRRVTLNDGRYLIFYTFGDEGSAPAVAAVNKEAAGERREPDPATLVPEAEDERSV